MRLACAPPSMMVLKYDKNSLALFLPRGTCDPPLEPRQSSPKGTVGSSVTSEAGA